MIKKIAISVFLLSILVFTPFNKTYGQCTNALLGEYSGGYLVQDVYGGFEFPAGSRDPWMFGFDCSTDSLTCSAQGNCSIHPEGDGWFSCDYDTINFRWQTVQNFPREVFPGYSYATIIRNKSINITTTFACSGPNGNALASLSGFSDNPFAHYSYQWSNGETTNFATGLSAGTYSLTITTSYSNGCHSNSMTTQTTVQSSHKPAINIQLVNNFGGNHDTVEAIANGGVSPYKYTWFPQDSSFNPAINLTAGTYTVLATDTNGCAITDTISIVNINMNTTDTVNILANFSVYPNPFHNYTTVSLSKSQKYTLEIDDISGRKLQQIEFTGNQYQLSTIGLEKELYFLRVFDANEKMIYTTKIVAQ